jgi:peptidyl-prolyl cis-trans isomerase C
MNENILAKVGDIEITTKKMDDIIQTLAPQQAMEVSTPEGRKKLLNELIDGELFYLDAVENGIDKDEDFLKIMEEAKHNLLQRFAIQKLISNIDVTEEELKSFYTENKSRFASQSEVTSRHILVESEEKGNEVLKEINEGLDFSEAAKKYSSCPSKERGGDLGSYSKGQMIPEFEEVAFNLNEGEMSGLVKTQFGYHIIITDKKTVGEEKPFEEVETEIKQMLTRNKQNEIYKSKLTDLKNKFTIEINEEILK